MLKTIFVFVPKIITFISIASSFTTISITVLPELTYTGTGTMLTDYNFEQNKLFLFLFLSRFVLRRTVLDEATSFSAKSSSFSLVLERTVHQILGKVSVAVFDFDYRLRLKRDLAKEFN